MPFLGVSAAPTPTSHVTASRCGSDTARAQSWRSEPLRPHQHDTASLRPQVEAIPALQVREGVVAPDAEGLAAAVDAGIFDADEHFVG